MKIKQLLMISMLFIAASFMTGCWTTPEAGKVQAQVIYGEVKGIIRAPGIWTVATVGDEYFDVDITSHTSDDLWFSSGTKDRAGFKWAAKVNYNVPDDNGAIYNHVKKFGVKEEDRTKKLANLIALQVQAEIGNIANNYTAYELVSNSDKIQQQVFPILKKYFADELFLNLENLQLIGKPDFFNDDIDAAPSKVVANENMKAAAQAGLEADKIEQQRQAIQAEIMANPALRQIKMLELQIRMEQARAEGIKGHQGNLTVVYGTNDGTKLNLNN